MRPLWREFDLGDLFITHNLAEVAEIVDQVAVMYGGQIVAAALVIHPKRRSPLDGAPR